MLVIKQADLTLTANHSVKEYLTTLFLFCNTVRIKSTIAADQINAALIKQYGDEAVDMSRPETWRYYLNVCGEYHYADEPMYVVSHDTRETILLSKETLDQHTGTAKALTFGTRFYKELAERYPKQESLILGILYPAKMAVAIAANHNTVIAYDKTSIEHNEITLIKRLNEWLGVLDKRWNVTAYQYSDDYYNHAQHTMLYSALPAKVLAIRQSLIKTREAHSFHVKNHLASNGLLHRYYNYLTFSQQMWLYKNIRHIHHYRGMENTLASVLTNVLQVRGFPTTECVGVQSIAYTESLGKVFTVERKPVNSSSLRLPDTTIDKVLIRARALAPGNDKIPSSAVLEQVSHARSSKLKTKVLDVSYVDMSGSERFSYERVALTQWAALSHSGQYRSYIMYKNLLSGTEVFITVSDALLYSTYLAMKSGNLPMTKVPVIKVDLRLDASKSVRGLTAIPRCELTHDDKATLTTLSVSTKPMISVTAFNAQVHALYKVLNAREKLTLSYHAKDNRGYARRLFNNHFAPKYLVFPDSGKPIEQWLKSKGLDDIAGDNGLLEDIVLKLFVQATGLEREAYLDMGTIHKALVGLVKELVSYSVQIVGSVNNEPINALLLSPVSIERSSYIRTSSTSADNGVGVNVLSPRYSRQVESRIRLIASTHMVSNGGYTQPLNRQTIRCHKLPDHYFTILKTPSITTNPIT